MLPPARETICAIVVTHHPDSAFPERIATLRPQVGGVVVVDNASNPEATAMLRGLAQQDRIALIENATNEGVATGLNEGVEYAMAHGFSWFITFDQDSSARPQLIESLQLVCAAVGEAGLDRLGVLGANHIDAHTGELFIDPGETAGGYIERKTVITAGSLMSTQSYNAIGPFRDDFFIDGIDHEYCLRARSKGYRVLFALAAHLVHATGRRQVARVLPGLRVMTVNHAPFRWYTMVRNRLIIVREYAGREPSWTASRTLRLFVKCARALIFEKERLDKARCMALGLADFATRRKVRRPVELIRHGAGGAPLSSSPPSHPEIPHDEPAPATPRAERERTRPGVAEWAQRARDGVIVLVVRTALVQLIVLGGQVALARLLTPSDFGAFAIIQFALSLVSFVGDAGLGASLIRKKEEPTDTELSSVFLAQVALSLLSMVGVGVGASFAGRIWPQLPEGGAWLLRALSGSLLLAALRSVPCVLMERELRFARLGTIDLIMSVTFYVVATGLAWLGWGIWSLATAVLVQGVLATGTAYALRPFWPRLVLDWAILRPIISFSVPFQMNRALGMVNGALAPFYAGAVLGPRALGLLNWAQSTAFFPLKLVDIISRVAFPLYSRIRDDEKLLGETFGRFVQLCFGCTTFFVALFCGIGEPLIHVVYGDKWLPALPLLHVYAWTVAIGFFVPLLAAVLGATDRPRLLLRASLGWTALAWVLVPLTTPRWGALGFAVGYAVHIVVANGALMALTPRLVPHACLPRRLWASALVGVADYLLARWLLAPHAGNIAGFVGCVAALLLFHIGALLLLDRSGIRAALRLIPGAEAVVSPVS